MDYKKMVNNAYNKYVKDWCGVRGYTPSNVDPEIGINGECYVCASREAEDAELKEKPQTV